MLLIFTEFMDDFSFSSSWNYLFHSSFQRIFRILRNLSSFISQTPRACATMLVSLNLSEFLQLGLICKGGDGSRLDSTLMNTELFSKHLEVSKADYLSVLGNDVLGRDFKTRNLKTTFTYFSFYK